MLVEKILPPEPGQDYPVYIKGRRARPPEDVGGTWGYYHFLEAIQDPDFAERDPEVIGNDYLVIGTVEHKAWREGMKQPKGIDDMLAHLRFQRGAHHRIPTGGLAPGRRAG